MTMPVDGQAAGNGHQVSVPTLVPPCCLPGAAAHSLPAPHARRHPATTSEATAGKAGGR